MKSRVCSQWKHQLEFYEDVTVMQINIIRFLPAETLCLWLVRLTLTQEIGMSSFSCFSAYILCRLAHHKDCLSSSLLILRGDEFVFVRFTKIQVCVTLWLHCNRSRNVFISVVNFLRGTKLQREASFTVPVCPWQKSSQHMGAKQNVMLDFNFYTLPILIVSIASVLLPAEIDQDIHPLSISENC